MYQHVYAFLLQLCLAALAFAAPVAQEISTSTIDNSWQYGTGGGIIGFIILILDIIVFSTSTPTDSSVLSLPANPSVPFHSRGPEVQPPSHPQAVLVPGCLRFPHHRPHCLLLLLQPRPPQQRWLLRAPALDIDTWRTHGHPYKMPADPVVRGQELVRRCWVGWPSMRHWRGRK